MFRFNRSTLISFAGLLIGISGLIVQWIATPSKFAGDGGVFGISIPPGILFIAACGVLVVLTARWWWHAVFGVLIAFWIVGVGSLADQLQPNLVSSNIGTVAGNVIMAAGLILAVVAGVLSMITGFRTRRVRAAH
ncbi:hypothetical protein GCM10009765_21580 [Fodinicola feengrottensis]|uniref:Integral membrane protein n=1 Tax=Fodinicola feengrottensis TaxID=435914 RepID=A0ABN2GJ99_9ACTN